MRAVLTIVLALFNSFSFAQACLCEQHKEFSETVNCKKIKFDNNAKLYWSFDCDSSWLTFESPSHRKKIIFSMGYVAYTGRLGYSYAREYRNTFLIQNRLISGCCIPPEYFLFKKGNGQFKDSLGRLIYYSKNENIPLVISFADGHYNSLALFNVDTRRRYYIQLPYGEISRSLKEMQEMFPENLFDEPNLKGMVLSLTYRINQSSEAVKTRTITVDLKKYR